MSSNVEVVAFSAFIGLILVTVLYNRARCRCGLPPGPAPRFFSGNTYQIPASEPWKAYANWSQFFGKSRLTIVFSLLNLRFQEAL